MLLGADALGRLVLGQISVGTPTAIVPVISDPVLEQPPLRGSLDKRYRIALAASGEFRVILPIIPFQPSWFEALSEPVRNKPRSPAALSPYAFWQPAPSPFVATGWYANLSEPVRIKPGLRSDLQQAYTSDTDVIPISKLIQWFANLSEPVRIKPGLKAAMQQFLASPSRLIPTPTSFGVLDATETKDTFLAGAMLWNRATDVEIGVINTTPQPAEIGLYPTAPTAGTITVRISVIIG